MLLLLSVLLPSGVLPQQQEAGRRIIESLGGRMSESQTDVTVTHLVAQTGNTGPQHRGLCASSAAASHNAAGSLAYIKHLCSQPFKAICLLDAASFACGKDAATDKDVTQLVMCLTCCCCCCCIVNCCMALLTRSRAAVAAVMPCRPCQQVFETAAGCCSRSACGECTNMAERLQGGKVICPC